MLLSSTPKRVISCEALVFLCLARYSKMVSDSVTTPEKWDSMTRCWGKHSNLFQHIRLVCIDECHFVAEARGSVLEAIVSRMHTLGSNIRIIALSATVSVSRTVILDTR
jgi:superfamily II helicase